MREIYVVNCCRTAIGSFGGSLRDVSAAELGAITVRDVLLRAGLAPEAVDEVMFGGVLTAGLGQNIARQVGIKAGLPVKTPAATINMVCGSGMRAVIDGVRAIASGDAGVVVAGGTENMSSAGYVMPGARWGVRMNDARMVDTMVRDGLWDAFHDYHMGITAENVCGQWGVSREDLDAFSYSSQRKAKAARDAGRFEEEIVAVPVKVKRETAAFRADEYIKQHSTLEALARLRPAFQPDGRVTAGNASGINDGAAAILLASKEAVEQYQLKPMARIIGWGQTGLAPSIMGMGPVDASRKALDKAGLTVGDMDLIEANEAFAAQSVAVARELAFPMEKVNVNGGAIALGHPIGASGARIVVTLLHEMRRRPEAKRGLATLCVGGGMGVATVYEKV